jgi:hypothetical protein
MHWAIQMQGPRAELMKRLDAFVPTGDPKNVTEVAQKAIDYAKTTAHALVSSMPTQTAKVNIQGTEGVITTFSVQQAP